VSAVEQARPGRQPDREDPPAHRAGSATDGGPGGDGGREGGPVLLGSTPRLPAPPPSPPPPHADRARETGSESLVRPVPKGWPRKPAESLWAWLAQPRRPLPVLVGGAEGGVGTSTVAALIGEILAAGSPGPTVIVDQCGTPAGGLIRRLVGQRAGWNAHQAVAGLGGLDAAPRTSAGAVLVDDGRGYTPLGVLLRLVWTAGGALVVDGGPADAVLVARLDIRPVVVVVGRADVIGAEAVCAALGFLHRSTSVPPVVVLSSTAPGDRRRVQAATKLVAATGTDHVVHLPHDPRLAQGRPLRLDRLGTSTASAGLAVVSRIGKTQEVLGHGGR
jgi:hypothetical protein